MLQEKEKMNNDERGWLIRKYVPKLKPANAHRQNIPTKLLKKRLARPRRAVAAGRRILCFRHVLTIQSVIRGFNIRCS